MESVEKKEATVKIACNRCYHLRPGGVALTAFPPARVVRLLAPY